MPDARYPLSFSPTFKNLYGAQMIAIVITTWLYGIASIMLMRYFVSHSRNDPMTVKAFIAILGVLATLEAIFSNHQMYDYFILKNGDVTMRDKIPFSVPGKTICIFLAAFGSQLFYASRIWKIGKSLNSRFRFAVAPITALAFMQLGGGLMQVVLMIQEDSWSSMSERVRILIESMYIHGAGAAACDILITISLVAILRSTGTNNIRRTQTLLQKLVSYAINRGILTSVCALLSIFLFDFASGTYYYQIPFSSNTHIYVISVVSMLVAREGLRQNLDVSFHISHLATATEKSGSSSSGTTQDNDTTGDSETTDRAAVESKC